MLGLAAVPASGQTVAQQGITVASMPNLTGTVSQVAIPSTACTAIPAAFPVQSARLNQSSPTVQFFSNAGCTSFVGSLTTPGVIVNFTASATHYRTVS
jgi:hypothetical protein